MMKYTSEHEWVRVEGEVATVGITPFAQEKLGDLVFVELPAVGSATEQGASVATVESVKAASDVYAPISGEVVAVNDKVVSEPGLVNSAPTGDGWLFKLKIGDRSQLEKLLDEEAYNKLTS